jgi:hypothetical protein
MHRILRFIGYAAGAVLLPATVAMTTATPPADAQPPRPFACRVALIGGVSTECQVPGRLVVTSPRPVQAMPRPTGITVNCVRHPLSTHLICERGPQPGDTLAITWYDGFNVTVSFTAMFLGEEPATPELWRLVVTAVDAEFRNIPILGVPLQQGVAILINHAP